MNKPIVSNEYLEIKNWSKVQSPNTHKWIKDFVSREDDPEFSRLTMFQRGLLEGICRLRARTARPICSDPVYISSALQVVAVERHCVHRSIAVLISRGFLIPCNQQDDFQENDRVEESRGEESKEEEKVVVEANTIFSPTQNLSGKPQPDMVQLLADMRSIWEFYSPGDWNHSPSDLKTILSLAEKHGVPEFLLAFDTWCANDANDQIKLKHCESLMLPLPKFFQQIGYYLSQSLDKYEVKRRERRCPVILQWVVDYMSTSGQEAAQ